MTEIEKLKITETAFRDAQQSLIATRMTTEDMEPILEKLDSVGYHSTSAGEALTFGRACLRFLNEDPWQRLGTLESSEAADCKCFERPGIFLGYRNCRRRYGGVLRDPYQRA